jgi:hypothetical protein
MVRTSFRFMMAFAAVCLVLSMAERAAAQVPATVYYGSPAVAYYGAPIVPAPVPAVSYYYPPVVSYYAPAAPAPVAYYTPSVSYYAPATAVTTTRYGLFGRPRVRTAYYGPAYVWP